MIATSMQASAFDRDTMEGAESAEGFAALLPALSEALGDVARPAESKEFVAPGGVTSSEMPAAQWQS